MNKLIIVVIVLVIAVVGILFLKNQSNTASVPMQTQDSSTPMASNSVTVENMAFMPSTITVKVGDLVTWTNQDSVGHSATADDGSFDTGIINQGQSGTASFSKAGTYTYHCKVHPNMMGTIIVQ